MLGRSVQYIGQVLRQRVPVAVSEVFAEAGEEVRLRATLAPLSSTRRDVDAVLGAANCARQAAMQPTASAGLAARHPRPDSYSCPLCSTPRNNIAVGTSRYRAVYSGSHANIKK